MVEMARSLMDYAAPPVARANATASPARPMSIMDYISELDLLRMLEGTGIPERAVAANDMLNPLAAIPRMQAASGELFAPDRTPMERVNSGAEYLAELGSFFLPMAGAVKGGAPAATALMEGLLGGSPTTQAMGDTAREFLADESGALRLFQGSPYVFDKFDLSRAGTGTGQQRYGAGVYLTDTRAAAKAYAKEAAKKGGRNIYEVSADVTPDDLIQWDKPFSEQTQKIQDLLKPLADRAVKEEAVTGYDTGGEAYQAALDGLAYTQGRDVRGKTSEELAAPLVKLLRDAGVKGAVFPDGIASDVGKSYVLYDDKLATILKRNSETLPEGKAQTILDMLQAGRAGEITDEMLDLGDPVANARLSAYLFNNYDLPMDEASRMARAAEGGFTPVLHGTGADITAIDPNKLGQKQDVLGRGFYTTTSPNRADIYAPHIKVDGEKVYREGANIMPLMVKERGLLDLTQPTGKELTNQIANAFDGLGFDVELRGGGDMAFIKNAQDPKQSVMIDSYQTNQSTLGKLRDAFGRQNLTNIFSEAGYSGLKGTEGGGRNVRVSYNPEDIRSRFARFDPRLSHLKNLSAAIAAGMPLGLMSMQPNEEQYP